MYATCIHCQHSLGANDRIEHFQTGRKLAFDGAKGRLWVVCPSCSQWNLTPLEERWEAIEECEKLFRSTPRRASTSEIALARVPEAIDLIRVGRPMRPEFAAWRYGERLIRRRRRMEWIGAGGWTLGAAGILAAQTATAGTLVAMLPALLFAPMFISIAAINGSGPVLTGKATWRRILHTVGIELTPFQAMQSSTQIELARASNADGWRLRVALHDREIDIEGSRAFHVLGLLLPKLSIWGASSGQVDRAVSMLDGAVDPARHIAKSVDRICRAGYAMSDISSVPLDLRLSLEIASQEEAERRALDGELAELEASWRRAEEVAAIADDLLLPKSVSDFIEKHRPKRAT